MFKLPVSFYALFVLEETENSENYVTQEK